jgi:hypothetical protein
MNSLFKPTLWTDYSRSRYFLIPNDQNLSSGDFILYSLQGDETKVDATELISLEITESEAREYLQADMNQALETAKNAFGDFMQFAAQTFQTSSEPSPVSSVLGINPQELQNKPEIAKETTQNLYTELQELLKEANLQNPQQVESANSRINSLQETLQTQGIDISEEMEELTHKLQEILVSPDIQKNLPAIFASVQNLLNNIDQSPEKLGETLDNLIQSISEDILTAQEKILDEQRQQKYRQSAQDAIAESFKSLGIPSFAGDAHQQPLIVTPADNQEQLTVDLSSPADIKSEEKTPEREPHILAKLTPNEIGEFHQALQMMQPYQRKQTQAMMDKLQKSIITRLGDLGVDIFNQAVNFFLKNKFPGRNLKLIQRYSGIAGRTRLLIQKLQDWIKQYEESADSSEVNLAIKDLETLFCQANQGLEELPTDKLLGEKELKYLIEIEIFREELAFHERFVKNLDNNPNTGSASNQ